MATPPYAELTKVREMLSRTEDSRPGTAGSLPDATIEAAILTASRKINARLGTLYITPFSAPYPELIVEITEALAAFDADLTFREVRDYSSELNPVYLRYKEADALLTQLQKGTATLPDYVPPDPDPGIPDNPDDGGSVVGVYNIDLCAVDLSPRRHRCGDGCMCGFYGWCT